MSRLNGRLRKIEKASTPTRRIYQIRFVASVEEARQIAEREGHEPWQPGERPRFIIDDSGWLEEWRKAADES